MNLYGFKGTEPALLYSKDEEQVSKLDYGVGFEETTDHEMLPGYSIYIEGLNNLTHVELSMCAEDDSNNLYAWEWYGTNGFNEKDVLLVSGDYNSNPKGWFFPVQNEKQSWRDFKYIKVVATKGQVLLASVRFECLTPTVQPSFEPTVWPSDRPVTIRPSFRPTALPSVNPSLTPTPCHLQYYFAKLVSTVTLLYLERTYV